MREYTIGTPLTLKATKLMLLGSGELGREIAIESVRLGLEVIAVDRYENAPAMQVAQRSSVINMLDPVSLRDLILSEKPDFVVPEVEAIATDVLVELEKEGVQVVPVATATQLTMDREGIRTLAARELGLPTSDYIFASSKEECLQAIKKIGMPCFVIIGFPLLILPHRIMLVIIDHIFDIEGEEGFRKRESSILEDLYVKPNIVLATGGGAVLLGKNREMIKKMDSVIYLSSSVDQILRRTSKSKTRPLLENSPNRRKTILDIIEAREPLYLEVASIIIYTNGKKLNEVIKEIRSHLSY